MTMWAPFHLPFGWFVVWQAAQWALISLLTWDAVASLGRSEKADRVE
jgi:hypothetical protein